MSLTPKQATEQWPEGDFKASAERAHDAAMGQAYDSRERRQSEAAAMTAKGVPAKGVEAKSLASVTQADQ